MKRIGFVQYEVVFGDVSANFRRVKELLADCEQTAAGIDLLVLPELAFTGYDFVDAAEAQTLAEPYGDGPTSQFMQELSRETGAVIVAGYAERDGDCIYNSAMLVYDGNVAGNYRKIHLFSRENDLFSPGDRPPAAVDTPAGRIGMMICFDWFFPEVARTLALDGAEVIAHPSNLVLPWCQQAMFARSVENHVFSITANRIGSEDRAGRQLTFTGGSQVLGVNGEVLVKAGPRDEGVFVAEADVSMAADKQINEFNTLLGDRRPELYRLGS